MSKREFIRKNRAELDRHIRKVLDRPDHPLNDNDREEWIMNDEWLYNWARKAGVRI